MRYKYLIGATEDKELVFAEFEVTTRNGYEEFSASFDTVRPFNGDDYNLEKYFETFIDEMDSGYLFEECYRLHCAPQDLARELAYECDDVRDAIDCSLYPEEIYVNGEPWYFESSACGQHDTRDVMEVYVNRQAYNLIHELWDKHHLKNIDGNTEVETTIDKIVDLLSYIDEERWIIDYIKENF